MELLKSTTFMTILWILAGIILILLGVYREHLYRKDSDQKQNYIIMLQKQNNKRQNDIFNIVNELKVKGEISPKSAEKIIQVFHSDTVSLKDDVEIRLSPSSKSSNNEGVVKDYPKHDKTTLKDNIEIKILRKEDKKQD